MGPYIIILVVVVIVIIVFATRSKTAQTESSPSSPNQKETSEQNLVDKNILFSALVDDGYTRNDSSYSIKFSKDFQTEQCHVEIELSLLKKKETSLDTDVYKEGFNIHLPDNVSPAFFEHVVFQNYNKMLKETTNMELLPNVQDGGYFLRSSSKYINWKLPSYDIIQPGIVARLSFFDEFPFINQEDYEQPFFQNLLQDGYQTVFEPQQMLIRFSKPIGEDNLSVYYVKALQMLFLASSKLTDAEIQEDFRDEETKLHHFTKEAEEATEIPTEGDTVEDEPSDIFPSFEEFKEKEAEFTAGDSEDIHDEEE